RVPERVVWLTVLSLAVLSAFGWETISRSSEHQRRILLDLGGLSAAAAAFIFAWHRAPEGLLVLGAAASSLVVIRQAPRARLAAAFAIGLTVLDLAAYGQWRLRSIPREQSLAAPWYARA